MNSQGFFGKRLALVIVGVCFVLVAGTFVLATWSKRTTSGKNTNAGSANATTYDPSASWPTFVYRPFRISVPVPTGMQPCADRNGFVIRNDECTAKTRATFSFTSNSAWDAMSMTAAFDDAFGQQLREAGLASIADKATPQGGKGFAFIRYKFSDAMTGVLAFENLNSKQDGWKIAVVVRRDVPPVIETVTSDVDATTALLLKRSAFLPEDLTASGNVND